MSERIRQLITRDLEQSPSPDTQLQSILTSVRRKNDASVLPKPSIEDIDAFISKVRKTRLSIERT